MFAPDTVIVASPLPRAITRSASPLRNTRITRSFGSSVLHVKLRSAPAGDAATVRSKLSPGSTVVSVSLSVTALTSGRTVTLTEAAFPPSAVVTVTTALPTLSAVRVTVLPAPPMLTPEVPLHATP